MVLAGSGISQAALEEIGSNIETFSSGNSKLKFVKTLFVCNSDCDPWAKQDASTFNPFKDIENCGISKFSTELEKSSNLFLSYKSKFYPKKYS